VLGLDNNSSYPCQHNHQSASGDTYRRQAFTVALVGNPNTGKTALFNALTGFKRHVANYPGVTVETAAGPIRGVNRPMRLVDLPGTYSLAAISPDEAVACDLLCGRIAGEPRPDAILAIVDAANPHRNFYLVSQLFELGLPVVIAVNMIDLARRRGLEIDCGLLSERTGVPVIPVIATEERTVAPLRAALERITPDALPRSRAALPEAITLTAMQFLANNSALVTSSAEAVRILMQNEGMAEKRFLEGGGRFADIEAVRARWKADNFDGPELEVRARYAWIQELLRGVIKRSELPRVTWTQRIDRVLTHKIGGAACLLAVLYLMFEALFRWAGVLIGFIDAACALAGTAVGGWLPEGVLRSLVADGAIAGVGGVLAFLPQILILFALLAILEDCGYMARAAYMNDRLMRAMGLSGRSFIPLLSAFACAVPAIMGTRAIPNRRERIMAVMLIPFLSCSARLPVYVLLIGAIVPNVKFFGGLSSLHALVMLGMYLIGVVVAIAVAFFMNKATPAAAASGFMIELPSYKIPRLRAIWQRMYFGGREFVVRAGSIILAVNVAVWALGYFPRGAEVRAEVERQAGVEHWDAARVQSELAGAYLRHSYLGRIGHFIEPAVAPIGWDWRIGMAVAASFPAREVVVAALGTIYNLGDENNEQSESLKDALRGARRDGTGEKVFTVPVALSIMIFFALCAQCSSTLVVIARETGSWKWAAVSFVGMTSIAYLAAWAAAAIGRACGW
jgi:ferrous iron transport protein B